MILQSNLNTLGHRGWVINILKYIRNNKGFTLVEVMIAAAAMGGLAVVLVQMAKTQSQQSAKSKISLDLAQMKSEIQTYFSNPAHCNANFYRKSQGALTITQIKKCSSNKLNFKRVAKIDRRNAQSQRKKCRRLEETFNLEDWPIHV